MDKQIRVWNLIRNVAYGNEEDCLLCGQHVGQCLLFASWVIVYACLGRLLIVSEVNISRVSKGLVPDQARRLSGLIWVQNSSKGYMYQQFCSFLDLIFRNNFFVFNFSKLCSR